MRTQSDLFRLTGFLAVTGLMSGPLLAQPSWAQAAPPPPAAARAPDAQTTADPPARVGRLALITGTVAFHTQDDTDWSPAALNYPVVAGNSFWTEPNAEADLELGGIRLAMNGATEVDLATLDAGGATATVPQGEVYLRVLTLAQNETVVLQTPRGTVTVAAPGDYGVVAGDTAAPTVVTVVNGAAQVTNAGATLSIGPGQAATFTGTDTFQGSVAAASPDAFLGAMIARNRPPPPATVAPPAFVGALTGGTDLASTGTWQTAPEYGQVWYPPVAAGWAPYQNGRWAYVQPWGWTWVDAAPWGFAPFHYGRWARVGERWGWVPGAPVSGPPVYAPALVTFFGVGVGVGVAVGGSIGWCPLAPGEVYRPWYHASEAYVRQVNPHITNITNITTVNNITINQFHNSRYAVMAPAEVLAQSRPVAAVARPVSAQMIASARPVVGREPIRPTAETVGVTPAVARQLHIAPAPRAAARPVVAGPPVHAVAAAAPGRPARIPLRAPTPAAARPGVPTPPGGAPPAVRPTQGAAPATTEPPPGPAVPGQPAPRPGEPVKPGEPARPGEAARPGEPARPGAATQPTTLPKAGEPVRPGEAARPAEAALPANRRVLWRRPVRPSRHVLPSRRVRVKRFVLGLRHVPLSRPVLENRCTPVKPLIPPCPRIRPQRAIQRLRRHDLSRRRGPRPRRTRRQRRIRPRRRVLQLRRHLPWHGRSRRRGPLPRHLRRRRHARLRRQRCTLRRQHILRRKSPGRNRLRSNRSLGRIRW